MDFHSIETDLVEVTGRKLDILEALSSGYVVESGTFMGKAARALAKNANHVDTIDPCDQCWEADRGFKGLPVTAHHCRGVDFIPTRPIDLLFIDSGFDRAEEIAHFGPYMAKRGIMAIDDPPLPNIQVALSTMGYNYIYLNIDNGLILVQFN
jgi:hypothetical protein